MIEQVAAMGILVEACPSFEADWKRHIDEYGNDVLYAAAGDLAGHLLGLYQSGSTSTFGAVGVAIERLLVEGTPWVKEFATVGVLEGIQNVWGHSETDPEVFFQFLGPESQRQWKNLNSFWSGGASHVD